jgi:type I restriction enzyme, S subunit
MLFTKPVTSEERDQMAAIHDAAEEKLTKQRVSLEKAHLMKSALMQDLLTGRVSVAPLLESESA